MFIKQLSIFVENKPGRLLAITKALAENGINLSALSVADTTDFGIARLIVSDIEKAREVLKEIGVISKVTEVIAIYIDDTVGGLNSVLDHISDAGISIEYMYAFLGRTTGKALMIIKPEKAENTIEVLKKNGVKIATEDEI